MARVLATPSNAFFSFHPTSFFHRLLPVAGLVSAVTVKHSLDRFSWLWTLQINFLVPLAAVTSAHRWLAATPGIAVCLGRPAMKRGAPRSTIRSSLCTWLRRRDVTDYSSASKNQALANRVVDLTPKCLR